MRVRPRGRIRSVPTRFRSLHGLFEPVATGLFRLFRLARQVAVKCVLERVTPVALEGVPSFTDFFWNNSVGLQKSRELACGHRLPTPPFHPRPVFSLTKGAYDLGRPELVHRTAVKKVPNVCQELDG